MFKYVVFWFGPKGKFFVFVFFVMSFCMRRLHVGVFEPINRKQWD